MTSDPRPRFKKLLNSARDRADKISNGIPPRGLIRELKDEGVDGLEPILDRLQESFGETLVHIAEELLGVALRSTLRGAYCDAYVEHRAGDVETGLKNLECDLRVVNAALHARRLYLDYEQAREDRLARLINIPKQRHLVWQVPAHWHQHIDTESWSTVECFLDFTVAKPDILLREYEWLVRCFRGEEKVSSVLDEFVLARTVVDPLHVPVSLLHLMSLIECLAPFDIGSVGSVDSGRMMQHQGHETLDRVSIAWQNRL